MPRPSPCSGSWPPAGAPCASRVPGVAGFEPVFFLLIPSGRVFGRGFGFVLGAVTIAASALITGGIGPWLPFQMFGAAWMGFGAGCLPAARGRAELITAGRICRRLVPPVRGVAKPVVLAVRRRDHHHLFLRPRSRCPPQPACLHPLRPDHLAGVRHPEGRHQCRAGTGARSPGARRAEAGLTASLVRCPGCLQLTTLMVSEPVRSRDPARPIDGRRCGPQRPTSRSPSEPAGTGRGRHAPSTG